MQKRTGTFLFIFTELLLLASVAAGAQKAPARPKCYLWEAQSEHNTVYILGSVHVAKKEMYPLDMAITKAFQASDILVVEVNLKKIGLLRIAALTQEKWMYKNNDTLRNHVSEKTFKLFREHCRKKKIPEQILVRFLPAVTAQQLGLLELAKHGFSANYGIDMNFMNKASKQRKKIIELETIESQMDLFADIPDNIQDLMLYSSLKDFDQAIKDIKLIFKAWEKGDTEAIEKVTSRTVEEYPQLKPFWAKLTTERNKTMAAKIAEFLKGDRTYFVIVGAAHLAGKEGIIELLEAKKGLKIRQVDALGKPVPKKDLRKTEPKTMPVPAAGI